MATSTPFHFHVPHIRRGTLTRDNLTFGWPHRVAAALLVLIGAAFVAVTLAANLIHVGPAFDRLTNDLRPLMTPQAISSPPRSK